MSVATKKQLRVVLIDDDQHDLFFVELALEKAGFPAPIQELRDGASAISYFQSIENQPDEWPHVVVMDLKMPRMNGDQVLRWLRENPHYREMPVIILSSSDELSDIKKTTRLGVLRFLTKETHCDNLVATLEKFMTASKL